MPAFPSFNDGGGGGGDADDGDGGDVDDGGGGDDDGDDDDDDDGGGGDDDDDDEDADDEGVEGLWCREWRVDLRVDNVCWDVYFNLFVSNVGSSYSASKSFYFV